MNDAFKTFFDEGEKSPKKPEVRVVGRIIKVNDAGWGFISSKEVKFTRIFFHWTSLRQDTLKFTELSVGMMVEFTPTEVEGKGTRALRIKVLPNPTPETENPTPIPEDKIEEGKTEVVTS